LYFPVEAIAPPPVHEFVRDAAYPTRPNPDIGINNQPVFSITQVERYAQRFDPANALRIRMMFVGGRD
jgi:hypothetical protein